MALASIADLNGPIEEVQLRIEQAKKLSDIYDEFILLEQEDDDHSKRPPGIHASELYPCLRKPVYSMMNVEKKPNVSRFWKQRFKAGTALHLMLQDDFHRMAKRSQVGKAMRVASKMAEDMDCYFEFEDEIPVSPAHQAIAQYWQLYSHCDGIFTFKKKDTHEVVLRVGLEAKSASPGEYEDLKKPKDEHVRQSHVYMAVLDIPLMWVLYLNKGNQNNTNSKAPWLIPFNPTIWAEIEDRFRIIHEHVRTRTLPDRNETIVCEFCPWAYICQPNNLTKAHQSRDAYQNKKMRVGPGGI